MSPVAVARRTGEVVGGHFSSGADAMRYEVVYTMSRAATPSEWTTGLRLVGAWIAQEQAKAAKRFEGAVIVLNDEEIVIQLGDSEDLRIERAGTIPIWSARAKTVASSRLLAGVLLALQYACSAEVLQVSSDKPAGWRAAAEALTSIWDGPHHVLSICPTAIKTDRLFFVDVGAHREQVRAFFRLALELDEHTLPDSAFTEAPVDH